MSHLSDLAIDEQLAVGAAPPEHLQECEPCRLRWETLSRDRAAFADRARPAAFAEAVLTRRRPRRFHRLYWLLWAPALLATVFFWPRGGERFKGTVATELYVKSDRVTTRFEPDHPYRQGDVLQLVYSAGRPYYLTAVELEAGRASLLFASMVPAGARQKLPRSFVLDETRGDERIFFWFSEQPLDPARALKAAESGATPTTAVQATYLIKR